MIFQTKGYRVEIDTWENDKDNEMTEYITMQSFGEVEALVAFCRMFRSENAHRAVRGFGNKYDSIYAEREEILNKITSFVEENPSIRSFCKHEDPSVLTTRQVAEDLMHYLAWDLNLRGHEFYTRAFEEVRIYHFPADVYADMIIIE